MVDQTDIDPEETQEWLESLDSVLEREGPQRAHFLLERLIDKTRRSGSLPSIFRENRLRKYNPTVATATHPW